MKNLLELQKIYTELNATLKQRKDIFDFSPVPSLVVDENNIIIELNHAAIELFNVNKDDELNLFCGTVLRCENALTSKQNCGEMSYCMHCIIRKTIQNTYYNKKSIIKHEGIFNSIINNKQNQQIFSISSRLLNTNGKKLVLLIIEDVTEKHKQQKALINSELKFKTLFNNAQVGIGLFKQDGTIINVNKELFLMFGGNENTNIESYNASDFYLYKKHRDIFIKQLKKTGSVRDFEVQLKKITGEKIDLRINSELIEINKEKMVLSTHLDITKHKQTLQKLKNSETRFKAIFNNAYDGILLGDAETKKLVYGNQMICKMLGYSLTELLELSVNDIHPKEQLDSVLNAFEEQLSKKIRVVEKIPVKRKDGIIFYADISSAPIQINNKTYLIGVFRDITERLEAEKALQASEEKYRLLVENQAEGFGITDFEENFIYANKAAEKIFEVNEGELIGKNLKMFLSKEELQKMLKQTKLRKSSKVTTYELQLNLLNKITKIILITGTPYYDENEKIIGTMGIFRDITDRKMIENRLKEAQKIAQLGIWELDIIQNKLFWSEEIYQIFECTPDEFTASYESFLQFIHPDDLEKVNNAYLNSLETKKPYEITHRIITAKGTLKYVKEKCDTIFDNDEKPILSKGIVMDITQLKENELKFIQANKTKDKLFSIIAHDLRNPFNTLLGFTNLLNKNYEKYDDEKRKNLIHILYKDTKNTYKLLEDLLTWSRTQSGKIEINLKSSSIKNLILEPIVTVKNMAANKNIAIKNNVDDELKVQVDERTIKTVIRNLLTNAIKFTHKEGLIQISTKKIQKNNIPYIEVSILDNGIGIKKENINTIFNLDTKKSCTGTENEKGTGLGLIICKEFIALNNGEINVESEEGKGSRFYFTIPESNEN